MGLYVVSVSLKDSYYRYIQYLLYKLGHEFPSTADGGRISKLTLKRNGTIVCNYDRGWDVEPADPDTQLALEILLHGENY